jgi:hypothetical protein
MEGLVQFARVRRPSAGLLLQAQRALAQPCERSTGQALAAGPFGPAAGSVQPEEEDLLTLAQGLALHQQLQNLQL